MSMPAGRPEASIEPMMLCMGRSRARRRTRLRLPRPRPDRALEAIAARLEANAEKILMPMFRISVAGAPRGAIKPSSIV